jgi:hypothetical protein
MDHEGSGKTRDTSSGGTFINENPSFVLEIGETTNRRHGGMVKCHGRMDKPAGNVSSNTKANSKTQPRRM